MTPPPHFKRLSRLPPPPPHPLPLSAHIKILIVHISMLWYQYSVLLRYAREEL